MATHFLTHVIECFLFNMLKGLLACLLACMLAGIYIGIPKKPKEVPNGTRRDPKGVQEACQGIAKTRTGHLQENIPVKGLLGMFVLGTIMSTRWSVFESMGSQLGVL